MSFIQVIQTYIGQGFTHVIPLGFDHILFILSIFLLNSNVKSVLIQCTVFTVAHSLTLGMTAAGYIMPDTKIVEPVIALSILFTAVENIVHHQVNAWRLVVIFAFGLIHGMGFANALRDIGLPEGHFLAALLSFNVGVELGQVSVILAAWLLLARWFGRQEWYYTRIVYPLSSIIASIALYWTIERIFT
jgi:hypothetical protein